MIWFKMERNSGFGKNSIDRSIQVTEELRSTLTNCILERHQKQYTNTEKGFECLSSKRRAKPKGAIADLLD
jgi:hypothetical protein